MTFAREILAVTPLVETHPDWNSAMMPLKEHVPPVGAAYGHELPKGVAIAAVDEHGYLQEPRPSGTPGIGIETPVQEAGNPPTGGRYYIERSVVRGESELGSFQAQMAWRPSSKDSKPKAVVYLGLGASGWVIKRVADLLAEDGLEDVMIVSDIPTRDAPTDPERLQQFMTGAMTVVMAEIHKKFEADESYAPVVIGESKAAASLLEAARENPRLFQGKRRLIQPFGLNKLSLKEFVLRMASAGLGPEHLPAQANRASLLTILNIGWIAVRSFRKMKKQVEAGLNYSGVEEFTRQFDEVGPDGIKAIVGANDPVFRVGEVAVGAPQGSVLVSKNTTHATMASPSGSRALSRTLRDAFGLESDLIPSEIWLARLAEENARLDEEMQPVREVLSDALDYRAGRFPQTAEELARSQSQRY